MKEFYMKLELYYFESCPFCQKVLRFILESKNNIILKDTRQSKAFREDLLKISGQTQVPCLVVNNKPKFESDEIIDFLNSNKDNWVL